MSSLKVNVGLEFKNFVEYLIVEDFFSLVFPFLLMFAIFFTVLQKVEIFKLKKSGKSHKAVIFIISFVLSFFGVYFPLTEAGDTLGSLMSKLFPNISALSIGILTLYLIGGLFGKNFFKNLFGEDTDVPKWIVGLIALGVVSYFVLVAVGIVDYSSEPSALWNMVIFVSFLITGIVLMCNQIWGFGVVLLFICLLNVLCVQSSF